MVYPNFKSSFEKIVAHRNSSNNSTIIGIGNLFGTVILFKVREFILNRQLPSFFLTRMIRLEYGLTLGRILPVLAYHPPTFQFLSSDNEGIYKASGWEWSPLLSKQLNDHELFAR